MILCLRNIKTLELQVFTVIFLQEEKQTIFRSRMDIVSRLNWKNGGTYLKKYLKETGCKPDYWSRHEDLFAQMTSDYPVLLVVQEYT